MMNNDPRLISPEIATIAANLPALVAIRDACRDIGFYPEECVTAGLLDLLAVLVESETPPDSPEHDAARVALVGAAA